MKTALLSLLRCGIRPAASRWRRPAFRPSVGQVIAALLALLSAGRTPAARAQPMANLTTLHTFDGNDGLNPLAGLAQGVDGNFYGTAYKGGVGGYGTVFRVTPAGTFTLLSSFNSASAGSNPHGGLLPGGDGNFYGTTALGEDTAVSTGTAFQLTPAGAVTTLANFVQSNGDEPQGRLVQGSGGTFYGTTVEGGANNCGTVFELTPGGLLTVLHSFDGSDGLAPSAGLVQGSDGNFYGTTERDFVYGAGTVFQITPAGVLTTLHQFTGQPDGDSPLAALVQGSDGNFYGTTAYGGSNDRGTVFQMTPAGTLTVLYSFSGNGDGASPYAGLVQGRDGNFYGTTFSGGATGYGTVFQMTPAGGLTTLYSFTGGGDGGAPAAELVQGSDGSFYGTTYDGGANNDGTIFKLSLQPAFFTGEVALGGGVYYLAFPDGTPFGYYSFLSDPHYLYHVDLGYEYVSDAGDGQGGVYLYDFASGDFFYTSPTFPFPCLYDFSLNTVLYYFPDPDNPGHYNTDGVRYFYDFASGQVITK